MLFVVVADAAEEEPLQEQQSAAPEIRLDPWLPTVGRGSAAVSQWK